MKKTHYYVLRLIVVLIGFKNLSAQSQLTNSGFENWTTRTVNGFSFIDPSGWYTLNQLQQFGFEESTSKSNIAFEDSFAVILQTISSPFGKIPGILAVSPFLMPDGTPDMNLNFKAFSDRPQSISFWFKSFPEDGDQNAMQCLLTKWNAQKNQRDTIAEASWSIDSNVLNYTQALIPFIYQSASEPDSMSLIFSSSLNGFSPVAGSEFHIDKVVLSYGNNIKEHRFEPTLTVFPNPFTDKIALRFEPKNARVELLNNLGESVYSTYLNEENTDINLSHLPAGVYYLRLVQPETEKIIVKKLIKSF
jgi:hypothetical protein